ncbi:MAG TPA: pilus assembly protein PilM [Verrucomicrobiae bacterium]|nr:pilus assembly protein PilM [Verrucomicrobiae bacterium]
MALPFLNSEPRKKRGQFVAVDLGNRTTKAVLLERRGETLALLRYALLDAPIHENGLSMESLSEHLSQVSQALEAKAKTITLAAGLDDAVVRMVELPQIPIDEMRLVLKNNTKGYLQQELTRHVFDCHVFPPRQAANGKSSDTSRINAIPKLKVLAAGAKQQLVDDYHKAVKNAGLIADYIVPGLICPMNALEMAAPEAFANDALALIDIGFKHSSICLVDQGELVLSRVINVGGDTITAGLAETMNITCAEAEGIKVGLAPEAQALIESQVAPLGRELRASLDFFEHQQDRPATQIYVSGGSARSDLIVQTLRNELGVECKTWSPTSFLQLALPGQQATEIEYVGPQLTVAIGAGLAAF